jgi:hypothetical protein
MEQLADGAVMPAGRMVLLLLIAVLVAVVMVGVAVLGRVSMGVPGRSGHKRTLPDDRQKGGEKADKVATPESQVPVTSSIGPS